MGHDLYREVQAAWTAKWDSSMRLVSLLIADAAYDDDPERRTHGYHIEGWPDGDEWHPGLTDDTGMTKRSVSDVLGRLAAVDFEMRVPFTKNKNGDPVFGANGHKTEFVVPQRPGADRGFSQRPGDDRGFSPERAGENVQRAGQDRPHTPLTPQTEPSLSPAARHERDIIKHAKKILKADITAGQARDLIVQLEPEDGYTAKTPVPFVRRCMTNTPDKCRAIIDGEFAPDPFRRRDAEPDEQPPKPKCQTCGLLGAPIRCPRIDCPNPEEDS